MYHSFVMRNKHCFAIICRIESNEVDICQAQEMGLKKIAVHHVHTLTDMAGVMRTAKSPPLSARTTKYNVTRGRVRRAGFAWSEYVQKAMGEALLLRWPKIEYSREICTIFCF